MRVAALWRYPVKSMQGESPDELVLVGSGVEGDRRFGVLDVSSGTVVSAKRDGRLLEASARLVDRELMISLPGDGEVAAGRDLDDRLSGWLGREVRLVDSADHPRPIFENVSDFEMDDSELVPWSGTSGSFVDSSPLHVLATSELAAVAEERPELQWDVRRFRPNLFVEDGNGEGPRFAEISSGSRFSVGDAELEVRKPCSRCVMTTRPQPGGLDRQLDVLRHVNASRETNLGLLVAVVRGGTVQVGDKLTPLG